MLSLKTSIILKWRTDIHLGFFFLVLFYFFSPCRHNETRMCQKKERNWINRDNLLITFAVIASGQGCSAIKQYLHDSLLQGLDIPFAFHTILTIHTILTVSWTVCAHITFWFIYYICKNVKY